MSMKKLAPLALFTLLLIACACPIPPGQTGVEGDLVATFRGNVDEDDCRHLSGVPTLYHGQTPWFSAFDDENETRQAVGLNYEHLMSGHLDGRNNKAPRSGPFPLSVSPVGSWTLTRAKENSPWNVSAEMSYRMVGPHYIDFAFNATIHDAAQFGQNNYALFFFASYMNDVIDPEIHFRGFPNAGDPEQWVSSFPPTNGIGNWAAPQAVELPYDTSDWALNINIPIQDSPRIAQPFYYGRTAHGMVYMVMFDKLYTPSDEIRFAVARWKLPEEMRPAWDFAYVVRSLQDGQKVGFRGRLVWKPWVSPEDCLDEYNTWAAGLGSSGE